jgi:hypothetical protein
VNWFLICNGDSKIFVNLDTVATLNYSKRTINLWFVGEQSHVDYKADADTIARLDTLMFNSR